MVLAYAFLALLGAVGTWFFNIRSMGAGEDYLSGWFANSASSSAAVDIIVMALAACIFIVVEARRQRMNMWLAAALVPLSLVIAVAFTFPLFLAWREWHIKGHRRTSQEPARTTLSATS